MPDLTVPRRGDTTEVLHGVEVADPYRWMEDLESDELRAWVDAVAAEADAVLATLPGRDTLRRSVAAALDAPRAGAPWRRGGWWFHRRNSGLQDHDVLWVASHDPGDAAGDGTAPTDGWRVLLDPNGWDGSRSLGPVAASDDGARLAYAVSEGGSDWQTWHVRDVANGEDLPDRVPWSKFTGVAWLGDGSGFVAGVFPAPAAGKEHAATTTDQQVVLHRLGGSAELVHALPEEPEAGFDIDISHDGRWLVLTVTRGADPETRLHVAPIAGGEVGGVVRLVDERDAAWHPIGVVGDELWCVTDKDAPLRRVVALPLDGGESREVLCEAADQLEVARIAGAATPDEPGWLVTSHLRDAASVVAVHDLGGTRLGEVTLDGLVSAGDEHLGGELATSRRSAVVHVAATSFQRPSMLVRHDCASGETTPLAADLGVATTGRDGDDMVVEQVFVTSGDVRVPVFLLHRTGVAPTGAVPTVLWGYGGFDIAVTPHFRPAWRAWVEHGGLLAVACLRGGSEYGRAWADDGRLANKQRVFDDALAVAAWLCGEGEAHDGQGADAAPIAAPAWTAPSHLGIEGRSNGGLLAAACLTQVPERFGSAVPEVGVLDLLRFHRFTIGWAWTSDYGDRVVPSHSFKFAAALRHAQGGDAPVVLRVDRAAGHGVGKPTGQVIGERVDVLAWHAHHLGLAIEPVGEAGG